MKKVISLLLVCMMMLSMVTVVSAAAPIQHTTPTITVTMGDNNTFDAASVADNGYVDIPVTLNMLPTEITEDYYGGIAVGAFTLNFDTTKLKFAEVLPEMQFCKWNTRKGEYEYSDITWTPPDSSTAAGGVAPILFAGSPGGPTLTTNSFETNPVLCIVSFTKVPGATGTTTITCDKFELSTVEQTVGETNYQQHDYLTSYFNLSPLTVTLSDVPKHNVTHTQGTGYTTSLTPGETPEGTVSFTVTPEIGYEISSVTAGGNTLTPDGNDYSFTLSDDTAVVVTATKVDYTITKGAGSAGGTFEVATTAQYGDTVTITATPDSEYFTPAYSVTKTEGGAEVAVTPDGNTATFTMPAEGVTVDVTFTEIPTYAITVDGGITNGTVTTSKALAAEGEEITINVTNITPGYALESLTVTAADTSNVPVVDNKFTMPAQAVTVNAVISEIQYVINVDENIENGTIAAVKGEGDTVNLSNAPATGYILDRYIVTTVDGGTPVEVVDSTFQLTADVNVTATFIKADYAITPSPNDHFVVTGLADDAQYGDEVVFTVSPAIGYEVVVSIEGVDIDKNDNAYSFVMPAHAVAINIVASLINYDITVDADDNALVTAPATANYAEEVNITADAVVGYVVKSVEVKDAENETVAVTDEGAGVYSFTMPDKDVTINVITELDPKYDGRITSLKVNNKAITVADDVYNYTVTLNTYAQQVQFNIVTVADDVTVDGVAAVAGESGKTVTLDVYGTQTYTIVVTPELGEAWTYTVVVTNGTPSTGRPSSAVTGGTTGTTLADVKNNVSAKLDKATDNLNKDDYSEEAWAEIEKLIEDAKADLENAKNVKAAEKIEKELLEAIEAVKTLEEEAEDKIPVDETIEPAVIAAPEKTEAELAAAEALYSDMEGHWSLAYVHELSVVNNVFKGNEDGTFAPDKGITRQEIAVALGRLLGLEEIAAEVTATDFTDDAEIADWAKGYVAVMNELGLLKGYADGSFGSNDVITREQLALILSRMVEAPEAVAGMAFDDADGISDWAAEGCSVAYTLGIIKGYPDNTFKGSNTVTRAEAVVMIYNYLAAIAE